MWSFNQDMKLTSYRRRLQTRAGGAYAPRRYYGGKSQAATSALEQGQTRKYHECCRAGTTQRAAPPAKAPHWCRRMWVGQVGGGMLLLISSLHMLNAQPAESGKDDVEEGRSKVVFPILASPMLR